MKFRVLAMLLTAFALAIAFLGIIQFARKSTADDIVTPPQTVEVEKAIAISPAVFKSASEAGGVLRLSGVSESGSTLVLSQSGKRLAETQIEEDGTWTAALPINPLETQAINLIMLLEDGTRVRSDETLFRIPKVEENITADKSDGGSAIVTPSQPYDVPTLLLLTAPGGPSKIFQSPFGALPISGPLSLGPIDYDDSGGAVFRGTSDRAGRIRLYANGAVIGDAPVQTDGQWFYIVAETLPRGSYDIVVAMMDGTEEVSRITVPFEKMAFKQQENPGGGLYVSFGDTRWQVRRDLLGGGAQYTAVFGPDEN